MDDICEDDVPVASMCKISSDSLSLTVGVHIIFSSRISIDNRRFLTLYVWSISCLKYEINYFFVIENIIYFNYLSFCAEFIKGGVLWQEQIYDVDHFFFGIGLGNLM